jgi:hypothetical protein
VAEHPYRAEIVRAVDSERRVVVAEAERPPRRVRVRAWSDRTTRIRLRSVGELLPRLGFPFAALMFAWLGGVENDVRSNLAGYGIAAIFVVLWLRTFGAEQLTVSPAAVARRRRFRRAEVRLGYDDKTLRWIAQRLRRAIEAAR